MGKIDPKNEGKNDALEKLRIECGEIGVAGLFWGDDKFIRGGGVRDHMDEEDLRDVARLLALGEKNINLKEMEFRSFLNVRNGKKL